MDTKVENDVYKLTGIGPKFTEVLESIGVDSIKELRHRVPENLLQLIEERHGKLVGVGLVQVTDWIEQAKKFTE